MTVRSADNSTTQFWVSSESDGNVEYLVDVGRYPLEPNQYGDMVFNGACIATKGPDLWEQHGCRNFLFKCEPNMKKPENAGKVCRCKHITCVRNYLRDLSLDRIVLTLIDSELNPPDDHQI